MNQLRPSSTPFCLLLRAFHLSPLGSVSVFARKVKKIDPEIVKQREERKRKRIEKEIRQLQKHSKKPKPVDEMTIDIVSAKNIQ